MPSLFIMQKYFRLHSSWFVKSLSILGSVLAVCLFITAVNVGAAQVTLSWDPPTTNVDGSPLTDLTGYKVYYGTASRNYPQVTDVKNVTSYSVSNLSDGTTYYFAVSAYDMGGNESSYSNEVSKAIPAVQQYTLTINKGGAGSGAVTSSPAGINCGTGCAGTYNSGTVITLTATPVTGSVFSGWSGVCSGSGTCSISIISNTTVTATFAVNTYTITASAGTGGSITPSGAVTVNQGATQSFTITPNAGYQIADVKVDGVSAGAVAAYSFSNVTANHTVTATFAVNTYTITASAGTGGSITPSGAVTMNQGSSQTFTIVPSPYYTVSDVLVDGVSVGTLTSYTFSAITDNHNISVSFNGTDSDNDGIPDIEEFGPQLDNPNYDGNNDGIPDYLQDNVASFYTFGNSGYITLSVPEGQVLSNVKAEDIPQDEPQGADFPFQFVNFIIKNVAPGASTTATIQLPEGTVVNAYYKFGPTPDNTTPHWYNFMYDGETGAEISNNIITLHFVDGLRGDDDLTADGQISDQGGPARLPMADVAPSSYNFGTSMVGTASPIQTFVVSNKGVINLTMGPVSIAGADAANFLIAGDTCSSQSIAPSGVCTISALFSPRSAGDKTALLRISSNDPDTPVLAISLAGKGKMPQYTLTVIKAGNGTVTSAPAGINCGSICSNVFDQGTTITLAAVPDSDSAFSGWSGSSCAGTGQCVMTMNADTTIQAVFAGKKYSITATSGSGGTISPAGSVAVSYGASQIFTMTPNAGYRIAGVNVDGIPVGAVATYTFANVSANHTIAATFVNSKTPHISVSPTSYNYGNVNVGKSSHAIFKVVNTGKVNLTISKVQVIGGDAGMFSLWLTGSRILKPSSGYSLTVYFKPTSKGPKTATLRITSNDPNTPVIDLPLSGAGM